MKKLLLLYCCMWWCMNALHAQSLHVNWTRFIGPTDSTYAELRSAIPSRNGSIVFTGTGSGDGSGDMPTTHYNGVIVGKMDSNKNLRWIHVYGGYGGYSICQTQDGGFGVLAYTEGISGLVTGYHGSGDIWLLRLDSLGNFLWGNCYGSITGDEEAFSIAATKDNGFILLGASNSSGEDVPFHLGGSEFEMDWFVVKTDSLGNKQWAKDLGGSEDEGLNSRGTIIEGYDGYYLVSSSLSTDYDCIDTTWHPGVFTSEDIYVLKLDTTGVMLWDKSFGGTHGEQVYHAAWDPRDSSIVVTGSTASSDYIFSSPLGGMFAMKVDKDGNLRWAKTYNAGIGYDINTTDSGYVLYGITSASHQVLNLFTLDINGNVLADTIFGGPVNNYSASVFPYKQGYIATGSSVGSSGFTEGNNFGTMGLTGRCFVSYLSCCPNPVSFPGINPLPFTLTLSPNPTNNKVSIDLPAKGNLIITNVVGQIVFSKKESGPEVNIRVSEWASGLYFVTWQGEGGDVVTKKLVIN